MNEFQEAGLCALLATGMVVLFGVFVIIVDYVRSRRK
jgi:hypothetical protein